jgi:DNA invertase Pin-like site-specific DNA recombinase
MEVNKIRAALYTHVSTTDQNHDLQRRELLAYTQRPDWETTEAYEDIASGTKTTRPAFDRLLADARARKFDVVVSWKLDQFGRNLLHWSPVSRNCRNSASASLLLRRVSMCIDATQPPSSSCKYWQQPRNSSDH